MLAWIRNIHIVSGHCISVCKVVAQAPVPYHHNPHEYVTLRALASMQAGTIHWIWQLLVILSLVFERGPLVIQIKYGLPYSVTCPSMSTDPGSLNPGRGVAEYPGGGIPGSVRILGQVTQFWQNILNLYYSTGTWKLFSYPLLAFCVNSSWKWRPVIMSPAHNPLLLQLPILLHSMTLADI